MAHMQGGGGGVGTLVRKSEGKRRNLKRISEAQDSAQCLDVVNTPSTDRQSSTNVVFVSRNLLVQFFEQTCHRSERHVLTIKKSK